MPVSQIRCSFSSSSPHMQIDALFISRSFADIKPLHFCTYLMPVSTSLSAMEHHRKLMLVPLSRNAYTFVVSPFLRLVTSIGATLKHTCLGASRFDVSCFMQFMVDVLLVGAVVVSTTATYIFGVVLLLE